MFKSANTSFPILCGYIKRCLLLDVMLHKPHFKSSHDSPVSFDAFKILVYSVDTNTSTCKLLFARGSGSGI